MHEADLSDATFTNCDLHWALFQNAQMTNTILEACDMRGTDFRGARLDRATIRGGKFGVVQQGDEFTPTRFDDTPENRKLVTESHAEGLDTIEWTAPGTALDVAPKSAPAGTVCSRDGFWFTPAKVNSRRYFKRGEIMPVIEGASYGATVWQWDANQEPPKL
jgi:hypothetical protein